MEQTDFHQQTTLPHFRKATSTPFVMPKMIGPYKVDTLLHKGSWSLLFLANHPETSLPIALKILSPSLITHKDLKKQFLEEAKIISLADHPNIVKLYGQGEWEQGLYIAMEFIQGISLRQFILGRSLSLKRILDIILQVSYALLHLHTHGVIHRDLKPENILITESGQVKVIDFGISQLTDETKIQIKRGGIIGTPSYMSPEQKRDPLNASYATDIYALGVILYELVIGKLSFGNIEIELLPKHLRPIVAKALKEQVHDRYEDIVDFITDISRYLKSERLASDRPESDDLKEIWESLSKAHRDLLPKELPRFNEIELGFAKPEGAYLFGVYYDFFRMPDASFVLVLAESPSSSPHAVVNTSTLRGIIRGRLYDYLYSQSIKPFVSADFAYELNQIYAEEPHEEPEGFFLLHLNPLLNEFSFVSSGFESIWHLPNRGGGVRLLQNNSPKLGQTRGAEFNSTKDSWHPGDQLVIHSFVTKNLSKQERDALNTLTTTLFKQHRTLSQPRLAEELLSGLLTQSTERHPNKVVFTLSRIS